MLSFFQIPLCACPDASHLRDSEVIQCRGEDSEAIKKSSTETEVQADFLVAAHPLTMQPPDLFADDISHEDSMTDTESTAAGTSDSDSSPEERLGRKKRKMSKAELKQVHRAFQRKLRKCTDPTVRRLWSSFPMFTEGDVRQALKENDDHEGSAHIQLHNLAQTQQGELHMQLCLAQQRHCSHSPPVLPSVPSGAAL